MSVIGAQSEASIPATVSLACAGELSSRNVFSGNEPPKFTLPVSSDPLVSLRRKILHIYKLKRAKTFLLYVPDKYAKQKEDLAVFPLLHLGVTSFCLVLLMIRCLRIKRRGCMEKTLATTIGSEEQTVQHELKNARKWIENSNISVTLTFTRGRAKLRSTALKVFEYASFLIFLK